MVPIEHQLLELGARDFDLLVVPALGVLDPHPGAAWHDAAERRSAPQARSAMAGANGSIRVASGALMTAPSG